MTDEIPHFHMIADFLFLPRYDLKVATGHTYNVRSLCLCSHRINYNWAVTYAPSVTARRSIKHDDKPCLNATMIYFLHNIRRSD